MQCDREPLPLLTWNRALLEILIIVQLFKKVTHLWNPYINYHVHMSTPQFPALNQINPFHAIPHYFHLCLVLPSRLFSSGLLIRILHLLLTYSVHATYPPFHLFVFTLKTFGEEYRFWSYSFNLYNLPLLPHVQIFSIPWPQTIVLLLKWQAKLHAHTKQQENYNMGLNY